jgi:hypothetical protein
VRKAQVAHAGADGTSKPGQRYREVQELSELEKIQEKIMEMVALADGQRLRFHAAVRIISDELAVSRFRVEEAMENLLRERKLVLTYRNPFTFVEIPLDDRLPGARPMKVVFDGERNPWICDHDLDPSRDLAEQGCWQLKKADS